MRDLRNRILLCHLTGSHLKLCSVKTFVTRLNKRKLFFMNAVKFGALSGKLELLFSSSRVIVGWSEMFMVSFQMWV